MMMEPSSEAVVDAAMPVIDTHMHLCDWTGIDYFAPQYLADAADGHHVVASVHVEGRTDIVIGGESPELPSEETASVLQQACEAPAGEHRLAEGIVGFADLTLGAEVAATLAAHARAGGSRFKGVRARLCWDPDPVAGYPGRTDFPREDPQSMPALLDGARTVERSGIILEVFALHTQLAFVAEIAAACPDLPIVVNHLGVPLGVGPYTAHRDGVLATWREGLAALARRPQTHVKLSGIGVTRLGLRFGAGGSEAIAAVIAPYIETCVDTMGAARCLFGSNFPVDRTVDSYRTVLNAYKRALAHRPTAEREAIFAGNARALYGLS